MVNGLYDKLGNWYEEDYVVWQILRLLRGDCEYLRWEGLDPLDRGVDCWIVERGERIAIQCKTHSTGAWKLGELRSQRVFEFAKNQLERTDPSRPSRYRFVTDAQIAEEDLVRGIGNEFAARVEERVTSRAELLEKIHTLAAALSDDPERLVQVLHGLAKNWLTEEVTRARLDGELAKNAVPLTHRDRIIRLGVILDGLLLRFVSTIESNASFDRIPRAEATEIVHRLTASTPTKVLLVHGEGGAGKSEILRQVVEALREKDCAVLAIRADDEDARTRLGHDVVTELASYVGDAPAVIVVDQIDRVARSSEHSQGAASWTHELLRKARGRFPIVVGCRTVDAEHDTQIGKLVGGDAIPIAVGALPEQAVIEVLKKNGIPHSDLSPDLRAIVSKPAGLVGLLEVARRSKSGEWRAARSTLDLMLHWWNSCAAPSDAPVIAELAEKIERDGSFEIAQSLLGPVSGPVIDRLVHEGLLEREHGNVRFRHQLLADAWIAQRWANDEVPEFLDRLGARDEQDLHRARQLRLTVPLLRGKRGAQILRAVMSAESTRPILRFAMLLGLAESENPDREIVACVRDWLEGSRHRRLVAHTVLLGQLAWFDAFESKLVTYFTTWPTPDRDLVLDLIGSVAARRGTPVARILTELRKTDAQVLEHAEWVFLHEPSVDSDELFELRLEVAKRVVSRGYGRIDSLFLSNPDRALRLLARFASTVEIEELDRFSRERWRSHWPPPGSLTDSMGRAVVNGWSEVRTAIKRMPNDVPRMNRVSDSYAAFGERFCVLIAESIGWAIHLGVWDWSHVVTEFVKPRCDFEDSLLLEVGARIPAAPTRVADDALRWVMSEETLTRFVTDDLARMQSARVLERFVENLTPAASEVVLEQFQDWIQRDHHEWSAEREQMRFDFDLDLPSRIGLMGFRLLRRVPVDRLDSTARGRLGVLERKYARHDWDRDDGANISFGEITSPVDERAAAEWTVATWIDRIRNAPIEARWNSDGGRITEYSKETLAGQLSRVVARDPRRYLADLGRLADPDVPSFVRERILRALANAELHAATIDPSRRITDAEFVSLLGLPAILHDPECARSIVEIVRHRPGADWPRPIVDRLIELAGSPDDRDDSERVDLDSMISRQLNALPCMVLDALAKLATAHETLPAELLALAERLAKTPDPARRAAVALAAPIWIAGHVDRASAVVLEIAEDPLVGGHPSVAHRLAWIASSRRATDSGERAIRALERVATMSNDDARARGGGNQLIQLRAWGLLPDDRLRTVLAKNAAARRAAAETLVSWIRQYAIHDWCREWAIEFANDSDANVRESMVRALHVEAFQRVVEEPDYGRRWVESAAIRDGGPSRITLLSALDDRANLLPLRQLVLELADRAATTSDDSVASEDGFALSQANGLVARLVEEAERRGDLETRNQALDRLDALIESGRAAARMDLRKRTL